MMSDITITRQFNVINGFVSIPETVIRRALPDLMTALLRVPQIRLTQLTTRRGQRIVETDPGVITCCGNVPSDHIANELIHEPIGTAP
jgi:hypothetical protein